jgi:hypothetical protein
MSIIESRLKTLGDETESPIAVINSLIDISDAT